MDSLSIQEDFIMKKYNKYDVVSCRISLDYGKCVRINDRSPGFVAGLHAVETDPLFFFKIIGVNTDCTSYLLLVEDLPIPEWIGASPNEEVLKYEYSYHPKYEYSKVIKISSDEIINLISDYSEMDIGDTTYHHYDTNYNGILEKHIFKIVGLNEYQYACKVSEKFYSWARKVYPSKFRFVDSLLENDMNIDRSWSELLYITPRFK